MFLRRRSLQRFRSPPSQRLLYQHRRLYREFDAKPLPKGRRARQKAVAALQESSPDSQFAKKPASTPVTPTNTLSSTTSPTTTSVKRDPFAAATNTLYYLLSVLLWLYVIGLWFNKPLLGVLLADPLHTLWHVCLAPVAPLLDLVWKGLHEIAGSAERGIVDAVLRDEF
ncbi:hypothetical protein BC830DRAFT_965052 [Chytriomyces sp. MP71]|nr:hypothetical protein BC830DRAFT_965052 [Chytriomyces sp. MP71]